MRPSVKIKWFEWSRCADTGSRSRWLLIFPILTLSFGSAAHTTIPIPTPDLEADLATPAHASCRDDLLLVVQPGIDTTNFTTDFRLCGPDAPAQAHCRAARDLLGLMPGLAVRTATRPHNGALAARLGLDRCYILSGPTGTDAAAMAQQLAALDLVFESVEPLSLGRADEQDFHEADDAELLPNDPLFFSQYALENFGQTIWGVPGKRDADIDAGSAWGISTGSPSIIVAVIDSGISLSHPDLAGQLVGGYNFTSADTSDFDDKWYGHGTHIAGVIGAHLNNGIGVAGLAPKCRLMPVRVIDRFGFTAEQWVAEGIIYATDYGASVLNISIGFASGTTLLRSAVQYAYQSGVVVCASSGNIATDPIGFPARYPETIAVGASDNQDQIASFTSAGPEMTVAAPGRNIYSTWDLNSDPDTYKRLSGTSFAVPYVAGTAALILSVNPTLTPAQVQGVLEHTTDDIGATGWDQASGWGRINAHRALQRARSLPWLTNPSCRADLNADGLLDFADLQYFLAALSGGRPEADLNADGMLDFYDLQRFVLLFSHGCGQTQP